jgi:hypothetical protein
MSSTSPSSLFSPSFQNAFWQGLNPDMRKFLDAQEEKETWTHKFEEAPELFNKISEMLPEFIAFPLKNETKIIIRDLIPVLASMPLRQCISAISWLDNNIENEGDAGWGLISYIEASEIYKSNPDDELYLQAKIIHERVTVMLRSNIACLLFCNIKTSGGI